MAPVKLEWLGASGPGNPLLRDLPRPGPRLRLREPEGPPHRRGGVLPEVREGHARHATAPGAGPHPAAEPAGTPAPLARVSPAPGHPPRRREPEGARRHRR